MRGCKWVGVDGAITLDIRMHRSNRALAQFQQTARTTRCHAWLKPAKSLHLAGVGLVLVDVRRERGQPRLPVPVHRLVALQANITVLAPGGAPAVLDQPAGCRKREAN